MLFGKRCFIVNTKKRKQNAIEVTVFTLVEDYSPIVCNVLESVNVICGHSNALVLVTLQLLNDLPHPGLTVNGLAEGLMEGIGERKRSRRSNSREDKTEAN